MKDLRGADLASTSSSADKEVLVTVVRELDLSEEEEKEKLKHEKAEENAKLKQMMDDLERENLQYVVQDSNPSSGLVSTGYVSEPDQINCVFAAIAGDCPYFIELPEDYGSSDDRKNEAVKFSMYRITYRLDNMSIKRKPDEAMVSEGGEPEDQWGG